MSLSFLVANDDGVFMVEGDKTTQLVEGEVYIAMDDLQGGIIYQPEQFGGRVVYRLPPGQSEPHELLVATPEQSLILNDVVARGDDVENWYTRDEGSTIEDYSETLRVYSFRDRSVTDLGEVAAWESSTRVSVSPDLVVMEYWVEIWYGFVFYDSQLERVEVPVDPHAEGSVDFECLPDCPPTDPFLSDDGSEIAWLESEEVGPDVYEKVVVVSEVDTGRTIARASLPDDGGFVESFDLGDGVVLVNRYDEGGWLPALLIELGPEPTFTELPIAGNARLVRS